MIRKICSKCGYDGTWYIPKYHFNKKTRPWKRCDGVFEEKEIYTTEEKLRRFELFLATCHDPNMNAERLRIAEKFEDVFREELKNN